LLLCSLLPSQ